MATKKPFLSDIKAIQKRAREQIHKGAITDGYKADRKEVIKLLNEALATEIVCVLRYKYHYFMASGINAQSVAAEFLEHANEEQGHADQIAERITQLEGTPNLSPEGLQTRPVVEYYDRKGRLVPVNADLPVDEVSEQVFREIESHSPSAAGRS